MARPRVVVGVGGASTNWQTLSWAVAQASRARRHLVVCYACPPDSPLAAPGAAARMPMLELAEPALARAIAAAQLRLGGDRVAVNVRALPTAELLLTSASPMDLLVVGASGRPGWFDGGSTAHHVLRQAPCPVVVVRPSGPGQGRARDPFAAHVVVGVDASPSGRAALEFAFAYVVEHRWPLAAVNVSPRAESDVWLDRTVERPAADPEAASLLVNEVEPWQHKYPDVAVTLAVLADRPVAGLVRVSGAAALLCVGNASGVLPRAVGSVAHAVVDRAPCSVAVVRAGPIASDEHWTESS